MMVLVRLRAHVQVQTTGKSRSGAMQMDVVIRGLEQMDAAIVAVTTTVTRIGSETEGGYESPEQTMRTDQMAAHTPVGQRHTTMRVCGRVAESLELDGKHANRFVRACFWSTDTECDREGYR